MQAKDLNYTHINQPIKVEFEGKTYSGLLTRIVIDRKPKGHIQIIIESQDYAVVRGLLYLNFEHSITIESRASKTDRPLLSAQIQDIYIEGRVRGDDGKPNYTRGPEASEEFHRWLTEHNALIWEQGAVAAATSLKHGWHLARNPYRKDSN